MTSWHAARDQVKAIVSPTIATGGVLALAGLIVHAVRPRLSASFWKGAAKFIGTGFQFLWRRWSKRARLRHFERRYLNYFISRNKELKLTGVVSFDDTKKPQLEQVFVSLALARRSGRTPGVGPADLFEALEDLSAGLLKSTDVEGLLAQVIAELPEAERERASVAADRLRSEMARGLIPKDPAGIRERLRDVGLDPDGVGAKDAADLKAVLKDHDRIAILGDPGSGKSTLLQLIGLVYAQDRPGDRRLRRRGRYRDLLGGTRWRLPVFIPLGSVAVELSPQGHAPAKSLLEVVTSSLSVDLQKMQEGDSQQDRRDMEDHFRRRFRDGNCVFLLDGLDEVTSDSDFKAVVSAVQSLAAGTGGGRDNQIIVTSREAGWRGGVGAEFDQFYVRELTDKQVDEFVDSWYAAVSRNSVTGPLESEPPSDRSVREQRASEQAAGLKSAIRENPGIRRLTTNPMLLSIIALVHRGRDTLPKERASLYAECSRILLYLWDVQKGVYVDDTGLRLEQKERIVSTIAAAMHSGEIGRREGGREAAQEDVQKLIADALPVFGAAKDRADAEAKAGKLLENLILRSGVIVGRRRGGVAFSHLSFQEYFTSLHFYRFQRDRNEAALLDLSRLRKGWWREVILLYTGQLPDAGRFIRRIWKAVPVDPLHERLRLAALCLFEAVQVDRLRLRVQITARLLGAATGKRVVNVRLPLSREVNEYLQSFCQNEADWRASAWANCVVSMVGAGKSEAVAPWIITWLEGRDQERLELAIAAVNHYPRELGPPRAIDLIRGLISDPDRALRAWTLLQLEPWDGVVPASLATAELEALADPSREVQRAALSALRGARAEFDSLREAATRATAILKTTPGDAGENATIAALDLAIRAKADQVSPAVQELRALLLLAGRGTTLSVASQRLYGSWHSSPPLAKLILEAFRDSTVPWTDGSAKLISGFARDSESGAAAAELLFQISAGGLGPLTGEAFAELDARKVPEVRRRAFAMLQGDARSKLGAAEILGCLDSADAPAEGDVDALLAAARTAPPAEQFAYVAAAAAVARAQPSSLVPYLSVWGSAADPRARACAMRIAGRLAAFATEERIPETVRIGLNDPSFLVRAFAANAAARLQGQPRVDQIIQTLKSLLDVPRRRAALRRSRRSGGDRPPTFVVALKRHVRFPYLVRDAQLAARICLADSLHQLGDEAAANSMLDELLAALAEDPQVLRWSSDTGFGGRPYQFQAGPPPGNPVEGGGRWLLEIEGDATDLLSRFANSAPPAEAVSRLLAALDSRAAASNTSLLEMALKDALQTAARASPVASLEPHLRKVWGARSLSVVRRALVEVLDGRSAELTTSAMQLLEQRLLPDEDRMVRRHAWSLVTTYHLRDGTWT